MYTIADAKTSLEQKPRKMASFVNKINHVPRYISNVLCDTVDHYFANWIVLKVMDQHKHIQNHHNLQI